MDPKINKILNKSSNRLLNKIRSNLNKPVTREVISDNIIFSDNRSLANTKEIIDNYSRKEKQIDFEVSLQNEKIKKIIVLRNMILVLNQQGKSFLNMLIIYEKTI